jgi:hypothetical protein
MAESITTFPPYFLKILFLVSGSMRILFIPQQEKGEAEM